MQITRTEPTTGGENRTDREEMKPLFDGPSAKTEPEQYTDVSPSLAWWWRSNKKMRTWNVLDPSVKAVTEPFALMDSEAGAEAGSGAGGVATYPFSDRYLPLSDKRDSEGDLIIDVNPGNFDERWAHFLALYPDHFEHGLPRWGGTEIMSAIEAGDEHYMDEFPDPASRKGRTRARIVHTDGLLGDEQQFRAYLSMAAPVSAPGTSTVTPLGRHGEWDEAWIIAIYGEEGGDSRDAYEQYAEIARTHPWVHPLYFASVMNSGEASEDIAYVAVPLAA